ncbi:hypothetical protein VOLCADRAFT_104800 [Volvox carteri f. nagariensis]|uniref:Pherophorin domain-containing protein n=1 Tax=Volvox carteri f. nagariensis TaxID=3068 RepID=D8TW64_VOLCA|nr:uncharacterized protein VOLCADRAFT_104800 [Volvox carteri f. nagariensis]EFJ48421.1 hypothetical protein VOLCADRAFT_104800 [Volvox carteri f. nagariensis]|eukprot:XP_002950675.1 hypothetical protein VOLCADRAFT_104800 [Volvox carteri f. nagariensis]
MKATLLFVFLAVALGGARADASVSASSGRQLLQAYTSTFPYFKCDSSAAGGPCFLGSPTTRIINATLSEFCFNVTCPGCNPTNACCQKLSGKIHKMMMAMKPACEPALSAVTYPLFFDGKPVTVNVDFDKSAPARRVIERDGEEMDPPDRPAPVSGLCSYVCFYWRRADGPVDRPACDIFANRLRDFADWVENRTASLGINNIPKYYYLEKFTCNSTANSTMKACANFTLDRSADDFIKATINGDNRTFNEPGLKILASSQYFNLKSGVRADASGNPVCSPSQLRVEQLKKPNGTLEICNLDNLTTPCTPRPPTSFPYCNCKQANITKTPYSLSYSRMSQEISKGTLISNNYCFKITADRSRCGNATCCDMNLDKIEWLLNFPCLRSFQTKITIRLSGKQPRYIDPVWSSSNDTSFKPSKMMAILKTTQLGLDASNANGAEICLKLPYKANGIEQGFRIMVESSEMCRH